jgi:hypothetical protein
MEGPGKLLWRRHQSMQKLGRLGSHRLPASWLLDLIPAERNIQFLGGFISTPYFVQEEPDAFHQNAA